jgi:hypothetical protein
MLDVPWSSKIGVHDVPAFVVFHTPPYAEATYHRLWSRGSTARSVMRPEDTAGPIERNSSPANVSSSGFILGFESALPLAALPDFAGLSADFSAGFAAGVPLAGADDWERAAGRARPCAAASDRRVIRKRIMIAVLK